MQPLNVRKSRYGNKNITKVTQTATFSHFLPPFLTENQRKLLISGDLMWIICGYLNKTEYQSDAITHIGLSTMCRNDGLV
jgi:hypothetical protein